MPLMNSTGAFKQQQYFVTTTPITGDQWIAESTGGSPFNQVQPAPSGDIYVVKGNAIIKLNSSGNKTFANTLSASATIYSTATDTNSNLYVGGIIDSVPGIIKYDSSGNIVWQRKLSTEAGQTISSIQVATNGDVFALLGRVMPLSTGYGLPSSPYTVWKLDSTGAVVNQRKTLRASTTATESLFIDNTNSKLYISGTEFGAAGAPTKIINGVYGLSNTDVAESLVTATSSTNSFSLGSSQYSYKTTVTDGTYIYQIGQVGGAYQFYAKINKSTGAYVYQYALPDIGADSITMDSSGYMYIFYNYASEGSPMYGYIIKIRMSDGAVIWSKKLGVIDVYISQMTWSNNFLYIVATDNSTSDSACIKLKDDGSLPNGTYTGWTFANYTPYVISGTITPTTSTTSGTNTTTSYTNSVTSFTQSTASVTITTTNIP